MVLTETRHNDEEKGHLGKHACSHGLNGYGAEHATIVSEKNHRKVGSEEKWEENMEKMKIVGVQRRFTYVITLLSMEEEIFSRSLQIQSYVFEFLRVRIVTK